MLQIITDSTCDIPPELRDALDIWVVPLSVRFGNEVFLDGVDLTREQFYRKLRDSAALPSTAAPSPGAFAARFQEAVSAGKQVLSIQLSAKYSSTHDSAALAATEFGPDQVQVVDTRTTSMAMGWIVVRAAEAARQGASLAEARALVDGLIPRAHVYLTLDSLENLRRGGRIGRASALLGTLLNVKPLISVTDGETAPVERVRTMGRAIGRLAELVVSHRPIDCLSVGYTDSPALANEFRTLLLDRLPGLDIFTYQTCPTIGTYVGSGCVGAVFLSKPE